MERHGQIRKVFIPIIYICIGILLLGTQVFAANNADATLNPEQTCTLTIDYKENVDGNDPVSGATFTIYKIATLRYMGNYRSLISGLTDEEISDASNPEGIAEAVSKEYGSGNIPEGYKASVKTGPDGKAVFSELNAGLYLVEETEPAPKHFASVPSLVALPHTDKTGTAWIYDEVMEPKPLPTGDLMVTKTVSGDAGNTAEEFHFQITLDGYQEPLQFVKSSGESGIFKSGDTVSLKHGEKVKIDAIPVGTKYTVTEKEANANGYTTQVQDGTGNIKRSVISTAAFFNSKHTSVNTGDTNLVYICAAICFLAAVTAILLYDKLKRVKRE